MEPGPDIRTFPGGTIFSASISILRQMSLSTYYRNQCLGYVCFAAGHGSK